MTDHERRQLLLARQYISAPVDKGTVCGALNGLQAQILSYARHALALRCSAPLGADWGDGLVKSWTLQGTMHIFPEGTSPSTSTGTAPTISGMWTASPPTPASPPGERPPWPATFCAAWTRASPPGRSCAAPAGTSA